jgi:predicted nucleic acid-binding protein
VILADTSVWIGHLNRGDARLRQLLDTDELIMHPLVVGEVALGAFPNRLAALVTMQDLPFAHAAEDAEVLRLIEDLALSGAGIGYMDAHLLASVLLTPETQLWTRDKALRKVARQLALDAGLA